MAGRKKKIVRRVAKRSVKLWLAKKDESHYSQYDVHATQPRLVKERGAYGDEYLTSKKRGGRYDNGSIIELCSDAVSKTLGLNLHEKEAVEVTFTFGKVVKL